MNARARLVLATLAALLGVAVTLSLGRWQLGRAAQKEALQAAMDAQAQLPALDATGLLVADVQTLRHRPVRLQGRWDAAHTVYLDNRQMQGRPGFFVLTPLRLEGQRVALLVQRGWVARNFQDRSQLPPVHTPDGLVQVEGLIEAPPSKLYQPGADGQGPIRQNLDLQDFRAETGLDLMPVSLRQSGPPSEGLLRDWPAVQTGVEKHYGYAFQWFALATLIAGLYLWFVILRPRYFSSAKTPPHVL